MEENENVVETPVEDAVVTETVKSPEPENKPSKGAQFAAAAKERLRKFTVNLKRKPQNIPFVFLLITSFLFLCFLGTTSKFIDINSSIRSLGLFQFVNTLASILIILIFLNTFPKRKKMNIVMLVITFAVLVLMIVMDILFIVNIANYANGLGIKNGFQWFLGRPGTAESIRCVIVHMVFLGITIILLALLPVFKKLLLKINTSKELASNDIKEEIDTSEEDG